MTQQPGAERGAVNLERIRREHHKNGEFPTCAALECSDHDWPCLTRRLADALEASERAREAWHMRWAEYMSHQDDEPHGDSCAVYDAVQHGPCDCGFDTLAALAAGAGE